MNDKLVEKISRPKLKRKKSMAKAQKNNINDLFQMRMLSDLLKNSTTESSMNQTKYKTFHRQLLEKFIEKGVSSGKMISYVEYSCFNSDDDSSDASDSYQSSLFYRYGMHSRAIENSSKALPIWSSKKSRNNKIRDSIKKKLR
jgi:hypothetical protein